MLLTRFLALLSLWRPVFPQDRSFQRAVRQAVGALLVVGSATLTRILAGLGRDQQDWSAEYKLHARTEWNEQALFDALLPSALAHCPGPFVPLALDDTRLRKTGKRIPTAFWQRDPLSPPFRMNLQWGLRFLQASLLLPLHRKHKVNARAVPVRFVTAPSLKKPGAKATVQEQARFREQRQQYNLSQQSVSLLIGLRKSLDQAGVAHKRLLMAGEGSFCNRALFRTPLERIELLCRTRADVRLCRPAPAGSRRIYDEEKFTPEHVRQEESIPWQSTKLWHGGKRRKLRYKELDLVLWQSGAGRRPLRLLVVAPVPYRRTPRSRLSYRRSAYLLSTDRSTPVIQLLQVYLDRWEIEVNHREEKTTLGVGQAQLWSRKSVARQPALVVAAYSALLLASLEVYGATRKEAYRILPKWRRPSQRPSCLDLVALLRQQWHEWPRTAAALESDSSYQQMILSAAA
ncbi:MAG: transposase [Acidobacteriaceae bacterium]|nr:transposase [Acidobacteriaceae bacterium]MBV9036349.1 transposase [Acidobacteriaceae bacterium]MBV9226178.1 transposase [Acidobacteriaceae bacterium]MBV9306818.1 transposase [Acidobacteriaceae bacterium]